MASIYHRVKERGHWKFVCIEEGQGRRTGHLTPPFYLRRVGENGKQGWFNLQAATFTEARDNAEKLTAATEAVQKGLTVAEADANLNRKTIKSAVDAFIERAVAADRKPRTLKAYRHDLDEFVESLPSSVRFLDQITKAHLEGHVAFMRKKGYAKKTMLNRLTNVAVFLKRYELKPRLAKEDRPRKEHKSPTPYEKEELASLFDAMTDEERIRYRFFLRTGAREQEVQFAAWRDIDFTRKTFTIQEKPDDGFTPKNYETRTIPLRDDFVEELRAYKKDHGESRWIFPNQQGVPDGHLLRKLKKIALRASLNCGHCKSEQTVGQYNGKKTVTVSCKTHPVCENFILHRFRKTYATDLESKGVKLTDIQYLLGHKNIATTQLYLGRSNDSDLRKRINFGD